MTAKEKAIELVDKFKEFTEDIFAESFYQAKQCALIAVDEILKLIDGFELELTFNYYLEVKNELNKL